MRKIGIFLALIAFLLFLFIGFQAANLFTASGEEQSGNLVSTEEAAQSNILVVHIDHLDAQVPTLVSLWVVFTYQVEPVSLTFLPIYPTGRSGETDLAARFSLSLDRTVSENFLAQVKKEYNIQWDHVVLIDQAGVTYWSRFLSGAEFSQEPGPDLLRPEIQLITTFCGAIRDRGSSLLSGLDWGQISPDHLRTDLPFDQVMANWDRIQTSGLCDVYGQ